MMIQPKLTPLDVLRRWGMACLMVSGLTLGSMVPITPQSEASAQVAAALKRSAARAATRQAASRQATRSAASRGAAQHQSAGSRSSASACRAIDNKCNGIRREAAAQRIVSELFPSSRVQSETFLLNRNGTRGRDPRSGKAPH
jgi:hypothetical protein